VTVRCVAPQSSGITSLLAQPKRIRERANELSAVLEIEFGVTRVVLGGDLPRVRANGYTVVPTGWNTVMAGHPHLGDHHGLKIPHHGSAEAQHPDLMTRRAPRARRGWLCTPFERSGLPVVDPNDGLGPLLSAEARVHLTKPRATRALFPHPALVTLEDLRNGRAPTPTGLPPNRTRHVRPSFPSSPLDAVWCVAFDNSGEIKGRWRGACAVEVIPRAPRRRSTRARRGRA